MDVQIMIPPPSYIEETVGVRSFAVSFTSTIQYNILFSIKLHMSSVLLFWVSQGCFASHLSNLSTEISMVFFLQAVTSGDWVNRSCFIRPSLCMEKTFHSFTKWYVNIITDLWYWQYWKPNSKMMIPHRCRQRGFHNVWNSTITPNGSERNRRG